MMCLLTSFWINSQQSMGHLEVTGTSAAEAIPEDMTIGIPVVVIDSTYAGCSQDLNNLLSDLQADLLSRGFNADDMSTSNFSITENYEYSQGERKKTGYKGQVTISTRQKYDPALINRFLKTSEKFKIQYRVGFMLSESQKEKLSNKALVLAVEDAQSKAKTLAEASGIRLGSLVKVSYSEQTARPGPLMPQALALESSADSNELKLYPGEVSVNQSVFMVWEIDR